MNTIKILKNIIVVGYYWLSLNFILEFYSFVHTLVFNSQGNMKNVKIIGEHFNMSEASKLKMFIVGIIALSLFAILLRAVDLLKDSMKDLSEGNYFSKSVIKKFKSVGILLMISGLFEAIGLLIITIILKSELSFTVDNSVILSIIIGLFFMFLSEVFFKARTIQQENDLTI